MPIHIRVVLRPLAPRRYPLEHVLQSWKAACARNINAGRGRSGTIWQEKSFDRIVRDEEHL